MKEQALSIPFSSSDSFLESHRWVHLEQVIDVVDKTRSVTMSDLSSMIAMAKSGVSAHTYDVGNCAFTYENNIFSTWFHFYVWPSSPTLQHTLSSNVGIIAPGEVVKKQTEFSIKFGLTDIVELDFMLDSMTYEFETKCYKIDGSIIPDVELSLDGHTTIRAEEKFFGVVRIKGFKIGTKHKLTTVLTPQLPNTPESVATAYTISKLATNSTFDFDNYPPILGTTVRPQTWRIEFINSSTFNVIGNDVPDGGSGIVSEDFTGTYFTLKKEIFSEEYNSGDYFEFKVSVEPGHEDDWKFTDVVGWHDQFDQSIYVPEENLNMTGFSIANLNVSITATWIGVDGLDKTETLRLEVPQCVKDALAMCGDLSGLGPTITIGDPGDPTIRSAIVYFSICTDKVLDVIEKKQ